VWRRRRGLEVALSQNFAEIEFIVSKTAQRLGIDNTPSVDIMEKINQTMAGMERIRAFLSHPIQVLSGYRCPDLNQAVGGAKDSQHMKGEACDFICPDFGTPKTICLSLVPKLIQLGIDQMIMEGTWVHVSFTHMPRYEVLSYREGKYLKGVV
jgi:zinc D-Ala-D-Ala carboxypeptidase